MSNPGSRYNLHSLGAEEVSVPSQEVEMDPPISEQSGRNGNEQNDGETAQQKVTAENDKVKENTEISEQAQRGTWKLCC